MIAARLDCDTFYCTIRFFQVDNNPCHQVPQFINILKFNSIVSPQIWPSQRMLILLSAPEWSYFNSMLDFHSDLDNSVVLISGYDFSEAVSHYCQVTNDHWVISW